MEALVREYTFENLTQDERAEFREMFTIFDTDNNNKIDREEVADVMRALGQNPCKKDVDDMFAQADLDVNGTIDFDEFCHLMVRMKNDHPNVDQELADAFKVFDKNGDGTVSVTEIAYVLTHCGEEWTKEQTQELLIMIKESDANKDGIINYKEFAELMCKLN
ncbi:calmodulin-like [Glandiceps talaboti]